MNGFCAKLLDRVKSLKLGFYGHTTRKYESLGKEMILGCVPGYRIGDDNAGVTGVGQMTSPNGLGNEAAAANGRS